LPSNRKISKDPNNRAALAWCAVRAALAPRLPPYLILFVTHRCNARCPFCFDRGYKAPGQGGELSLSEIEKIASKWPGLLQVTLTGGEPFMRDDVGAIALAFVRAGAASITIDTNGTMPDKVAAAVNEVLDDAPSLILDLNVSIDGPAELHDELRGIDGAHDLAMETARALAPLQQDHPGFRLGATVTVSAFNQDSAAETVAELCGAGLFKRVAPILARGKPADPKALDYDLSVYEDCLNAISLDAGGSLSSRLKSALSSRVREVVLETRRRDSLLLPCKAGATMVEVDAFGAVYPCEMLWQLKPGGDDGRGIDSWVMGTLREADYDVARVLATKNAARIIEWIKDTRCFCAFECAAFNNVAFRPSEWPSLIAGAMSRRP